MSYVTPAQVRAVLSADGTADAATAAVLTDAAIKEAILDAQVEVDGRVGQAPYTDSDPALAPGFGASPAPPLVAQITRDIAAYLATLVFLRGDKLDPQAPIALRNARARTVLLDLSSGKIDLATTKGAMPIVQTQNPYTGNLFQPDDFGIGPAGTRSTPYGFGWQLPGPGVG